MRYERAAVSASRDDGTFPEVSIAVSRVVAGMALAGLVGACQGGNGITAPPKPAPASTAASSSTVTSVPTPTTSTTAVPNDGFVAAPAGTGLAELAAPLGTVVRIDPRILEVALVPGTAEPGGTFPEGGQVPLARRPLLVAATNAGFKRADARGGELVDGRTAGTLRLGAATFVVRGDGTFDVGAWQQGVAPQPDDVVVLQNLVLLVDNRQAGPDLGTDILGRWGLTFRPAVPVSVWRSGLGIDAQGRLLYAAGPNLVPAQLATLLIAGGAVRGMQLDINHLWVFAAAFTHRDTSHPEVVTGQALLAGMTPTADHVLAPGARDFLAIFQRVAP